MNLSVANGISKVYIGFPQNTQLYYESNQPILIYRIYQGEKPATYNSVVTSFGTVTEYKVVKSKGKRLISESEFIKLIGNKSFFSEQDLKDFYRIRNNVVMINMLYNGFFGAGNNVNHHWLKENGYFENHPYNTKITQQEFIHILRKGGKNEQNVIVD